MASSSETKPRVHEVQRLGELGKTWFEKNNNGGQNSFIVNFVTSVSLFPFDLKIISCCKNVKMEQKVEYEMQTPDL